MLALQEELQQVQEAAADREARVNELSAESARLKGQVTRLEKELAFTKKQKKAAGETRATAQNQEKAAGELRASAKKQKKAAGAMSRALAARSGMPRKVVKRRVDCSLAPVTHDAAAFMLPVKVVMAKGTSCWTDINSGVSCMHSGRRQRKELMSVDCSCAD